MRKVFLTLLTTVSLIVSLGMTVFASESTTITQDDYEEIMKSQELEVTAEKGSVFTVKVPILSNMSSNDWDLYKYNTYYWSTGAEVIGDIASNEQLTIDVIETLTMHPEGGLKDSIDWVCYVVPGIVGGNNIITSEDLESPFLGSRRFEILVKPNKDTTAGLWRGSIHCTVNLEERGITLNTEQFKQYIESDATVSEITIPKYIEVEGVQYRVDGIYDGVFKDFLNIEHIYLETDYQFSFSNVFGSRGRTDYTSDTITIHANDIPVSMGGYADMSSSILYEGCQLYLMQNPFNGWNGSPATGNNYYHYDDIDTIPLDNFIGGDYILGNWSEVYLDPNVKAISYSAFQNCYINKLHVPEFKYLNGYYSDLFKGCEVLEAEVDNYYVGEYWFADCTLLTKVTLTDNVEFIDKNAFAGCTSLEEIVIPESVKHIDPSAFSGTPFLENLKKGVEKVYINGCFVAYGELYDQGSYFEFPADIGTVSSAFVSDSVTHLAFEETDKSFDIAGYFPNIKTLDLTGRKFNGYPITAWFPNVSKIIAGGKSNTMTSLENNTTISEIILTDGFKQIFDSDFNHTTGYNGSSFYIPKTVERIGSYSTTYVESSGTNAGRKGSGWGNHVFYDFGKDGVFKEFDVDEESPYYTDVDGILYTKDLEALVAVPRAYQFENGVYELPNEVKRLGELSFSRNTSVKELVISDSLEIFNNTTELEDYYNNNFCNTIYCMNEGNSLTLAVYQFTKIEKYSVRDTNPNYVSIDGVLYTKDLKELVAVPHSYKGELKIPEGCEVWRENALWLDFNYGYGVNEGITTISIPSTMKSIDEKQLEYIRNRWGSSLKIDPNNTSYARHNGNIQKSNNITSTGTWNGNTGTTWYNSVQYNIGRDPSTAYAAYSPIYVPEGIWAVEITDKSYGEPQFNIVFGKADGYVTSGNIADVQIRYAIGTGYIAIEEGGAHAYMSARYRADADTEESIGDMNEEWANALLSSLKFTKVADIAIVPQVSWTNTNGIATRVSSGTTSSTRDAIKVEKSGTYVITLGQSVGDYKYEIFELNSDNSIIKSSGLLSAGESFTITNADKYAVSFRRVDGATMTYDDAILLANNLVSTKLEGHVHNYSEEIILADCVYDGVKLYNCDCNHTYSIVLPKLGHEYIDGICTVCEGLEVIEYGMDAGLYNPYGVYQTSWEDLISQGFIRVNGATLQSVDKTIKGTLIVKDGIVSTATNAMRETSLTRVILPEGFETIGQDSFSYSNVIEEVVFPSTLKTVGYNSFRRCISLGDVILPEGVVTIERCAFGDCASMKNFVIPSTVETIGDIIFYATKGLENVYICNETGIPSGFNGNAFGGVVGKPTIHFKNETAYQSWIDGGKYGAGGYNVSPDYNW